MASSDLCYIQIADHILENELEEVEPGGGKTIWKAIKLIQAREDGDLT